MPLLSWRRVEQLPSDQEIRDARRAAARAAQVDRERAAAEQRRDAGRRSQAEQASREVVEEFLRKAPGVVPRTRHGFVVRRTPGGEPLVFLRKSWFGVKWTLYLGRKPGMSSYNTGPLDRTPTAYLPPLEATEAWRKFLSEVLLGDRENDARALAPRDGP